MLREDFADAVLRLLFVEVPADIPDFVHFDLAQATNLAYQTLWTSAEAEFFTQKPATLTVTKNIATYALASSVQAVRPPATFNGAPLIAVTDEGVFDRPALLGLTLSNSGTPKIYCVLSENAGSTVADAVKLTLKLKPIPSASGSFAYTAHSHPPRFTACDLRSDMLSLPAPHEFVEGVVVPLTRYYLTRSHWFSNHKMLGELKADYREAMNKLGLLIPQEPQTPRGPTLPAQTQPQPQQQ